MLIDIRTSYQETHFRLDSKVYLLWWPVTAVIHGHTDVQKLLHHTTCSTCSANRHQDVPCRVRGFFGRRFPKHVNHRGLVEYVVFIDRLH
jgi:hypothetical protein